MPRLLTDDQDALPPETSCRATQLIQERRPHPSTSPSREHHAARLGIVVRGHTRVADHLAAGAGEEMHRAIEMVALVELDLQVQGFGRLAGAPQAIDVRPVRASEARLPGDVPSGHETTA